MKVLILAAGRGSRLGERTSSMPKVLLTYKGRTLLDWHIHNIKTIDTDIPIFVVVGYRCEEFLDDRLTYIFNPFWESKNICSSLWAAREMLSDGPTLIVYGDVLYEPELIAGLLKERKPCVASVSNWSSVWSNRLTDPITDLETFVVNKKSGTLLDIGQRPKTLSEIQGQFAGLFTLEEETWRSMSSNPQLNGLDCTSLIRNEITLGRKFRVYEYTGMWREFDLPIDFT